MSLEEEYLRWRRGTPVGCMFARAIAIRPQRYSQRIEAIGGNSPQSLALAIAAHADQCVGDPETAAIALLFPELSNLGILAQAALALAACPNWSVTRTAVDGTPAGDMVAFHITRDIPFGSTTCPSEALVLGPFNEFPPTRKAPVTALEMFVGDPMPHDPKTGNPTTKAQLAHMALPMVTDTAFKTMWDKSIEGRKASLRCDDGRAKAKISFVIPAALAAQLGCTP